MRVYISGKQTSCIVLYTSRFKQANSFLAKVWNAVLIIAITSKSAFTEGVNAYIRLRDLCKSMLLFYNKVWRERV